MISQRHLVVYSFGERVFRTRPKTTLRRMRYYYTIPRAPVIVSENHVGRPAARRPDTRAVTNFDGRSNAGSDGERSADETLGWFIGSGRRGRRSVIINQSTTPPPSRLQKYRFDFFPTTGRKDATAQQKPPARTDNGKNLKVKTNCRRRARVAMHVVPPLPRSGWHFSVYKHDGPKFIFVTRLLSFYLGAKETTVSAFVRERNTFLEPFFDWDWRELIIDGRRRFVFTPVRLITLFERNTDSLRLGEKWTGINEQKPVIK